MHYRYNHWLSSHWETIVEMIKEVYETKDNVDDFLILGQYLHIPAEQIKKNIQSSEKINKLIVYQLEPLVANHWWQTQHIINNIRHADEVWDYDLQNIEILRRHGIDAKFKPIKYAKNLERIQNSENPDIDLLFYGTPTPYRQDFIRNFTTNLVIYPGEELIAKLNFVWLYNISDHKLDEFIGRSKIVLNLPPYESETRQQQTRIGYLLNNNKCVLSKHSPINYFGDSIIEFGDYNNLKNQVLHVIQNNKWQNNNNSFKKPKR